MKKISLPKFRMSRRVFSYPYIIFLVLFVVLPLTLVLINAFMADGELTFNHFIDFFSKPANFSILGLSFVIGIVTTLLCFIIGYPVALLIHKYHKGSILALLFIVPMWVNFLMRTLSIREIFSALDIKLGMLTVIIGMVYTYLPFMILPLYTVISNIDESYHEAARDLGADGLTVLLKTTLPLSVPGIISGITMVFVPTISTYAISELLSDGKIELFGDSLNLKFSHGMYGVGSVMSIIMLIFVLFTNFFMNKYNKSDNRSAL